MSEQVDPAIAKQAAAQLGNSPIGQQAVAQLDSSGGQQLVGQIILTKNLPPELKSSLPTIEEIEAELGGSHV